MYSTVLQGYNHPYLTEIKQAFPVSIMVQWDGTWYYDERMGK